MSKKIDDKQVQSLPIALHYLKTNNYRTFHVDGVFGGPTPRGDIYMELFTERAPTPRVVFHQLKEDFSLGEEISRESKEGVIREVEAGIVMNLHTAEIVNKWLSEKIKKMKKNPNIENK